MQIAKLIVVMSPVLLWAVMSRGEVFLEPYVGIGKTEVHYGELKDISDGFMLGVKGGLLFGSKKYLIGADYHSGGPYRFGTLLNKAEWNHRMLGAGLGLDYKVIRFWAGYYFDNKLEDTKSGITYTGTAIKGGFGLLVVKQVRANLEMVFHEINKLSQFGFESDFTDYRVITTNVAISIPLDF